ncbi:sortase [Planctobacterium marinum]|nr:sortase [Planctobacterium marinum]
MGHRDTHFAILEAIQPGELIEVETRYGKTLYRVDAVRIAHESQADVVEETLSSTLTLITCYPFNSVQAGTDMRFIVTANKISE